MRSYYLLTNQLNNDEQRVIERAIIHVEAGERKIGIRQLAEECSVSASFIVKLCKRLGFEGYTELLYDLGRHAGRANAPDAQAHLLNLIDNAAPDTAARFASLLARYESGRISVIGEGFASMVASYMAQRLAICGFTAFNQIPLYDFLFVPGKSDAKTPVNAKQAANLLIAISQSGETKPIVDTARRAKEEGYAVISFTRRRDSALAGLSDLTLLVDAARQSLISSIPNPFFGTAILAFEELLGAYLAQTPGDAATAPSSPSADPTL